MSRYPDLIRRICFGSVDDSLAAWGELFRDGKLFERAVRLIIRAGRSRSEGEDIAQDAIIKVYEKLRDGEVRNAENIEGFYLGIVKMRLANFRRKKDNSAIEYEIDENLVSESSPFAFTLSADVKNMIEKYMSALDSFCQELLQYWMLDFETQAIADLMGFDHPDRVKRETYKCRQRLKDFFKGLNLDDIL